MTETITNPLGDSFTAPDDPRYGGLGSAFGDRRDGSVYVHTRPLQLALEVALATRRPLLLRGPAGSGKSSLAPFAARKLERRFYWATVTARTEARDLMWSFDALKRLNDAQVRRRGRGASAATPVARVENYIEPRALWWAFDSATARRRGLPEGQFPDSGLVRDPGVGPEQGDAVVLIDEIDKADPDVPNNLLEALGSMQFTVAETGRVVRSLSPNPPLVIITTNDERELPAAFYRRCVVHFLEQHSPTELAKIAATHFAGRSLKSGADPTPVYEHVATELKRYAGEARTRYEREPSTAEFLDAVLACLDLNINPHQQDSDWEDVARLTLVKRKPEDKS